MTEPMKESAAPAAGYGTRDLQALRNEIFPNRIRGRAVSIAVFANWSVNGATAFLFPWFAASFGMHAVFLTFAGICCVATVFFWRFVPETKGRSLEEIEAYWLARRR
jgi:SP family arabinose:H+ symporter-like MFS transporter